VTCVLTVEVSAFDEDRDWSRGLLFILSLNKFLRTSDFRLPTSDFRLPTSD
jgi:hypothetical protein